MSDWAQKDLVEVGLSSCARVDMVGWETGSWTPKGLVEVGDKQLHLNGLSWVGNKRKKKDGKDSAQMLASRLAPCFITH